MDLTGYECSLNDTPLHDRLDKGPISPKEYLARALFLFRQLRQQIPAELHASTRMIVAINGSSSTLRLHHERPTERWLASDLEGYQDEAVGTWLLSETFGPME
jgi:hypothetical protein